MAQAGAVIESGGAGCLFVFGRTTMPGRGRASWQATLRCLEQRASILGLAPRTAYRGRRDALALKVWISLPARLGAPAAPWRLLEGVALVTELRAAPVGRLRAALVTELRVAPMSGDGALDQLRGVASLSLGIAADGLQRCSK